jgi:protein-S-isoprenylcysteine O-methyltransferase Ste14
MTSEDTFRAVAIASLALCVPIGLYYRIRSQASGERLDRRQEGLPTLVGLRLCGLLALVVLVAYLRGAAWAARFSAPLPSWLRWAGAGVALLVVPPLLFWTFHSLGKNLTDTVVTRREHALVTYGPYRWVRHPFYDVGFLWGLSLSLLSANWLLALLGSTAIGILVARSGVEERNLEARFGDDYRAYAGRTGRFFPRLRR